MTCLLCVKKVLLGWGIESRGETGKSASAAIANQI